MTTKSTGRARCARTIGLTTGGPTGGSRREVPFCTAVRIAPAVVLARYSVPEWVRSIDDAGGVGPCSQHRREVAPTDTYG